MKSEKIKVLFSGGGTAGPVAPLLAVADQLKSEDAEILWVGTDDGPEQIMIGQAGYEFKAIKYGKLRRYFSWQNFTDIYNIAIAFYESFFILRRFEPDVVVSAGAFVSVPMVWAAWFLRIPVLIHQQDLRPGLANKLMAPFAKLITVTFEKSLKDYGKKARWIGNPIRKDFLAHKLSKKEAKEKFGLRNDKPIVVVMGGGTGAKAINDILLDCVPKLVRFCQVIHITGKDKAGDENDKMMEVEPGYKYFEFMDKFGMIKAYTVADCVVARCGMSTLTELSLLGIKSVLIPMPDSHQEDNALVFKEAKAALVLDQKKLKKEEFIDTIRKVIKEEDLGESLSMNIRKVIKDGASEEMTEIIKKLKKEI